MTKSRIKIGTFPTARMARAWSHHARLRANEQGQVVLMFALFAPILFGLAGIAIDFAAVVSTKQRLQGIADAAATSAAREFVLSNVTKQKIEKIAEAYIALHLENRKLEKQPTIDVAVDDQALQVKVSLTVEQQVYFPRFASNSDFRIKVEATARLMGDNKLCALALNEQDSSSIFLDKNGRITGNGCAVYANSRDPRAIYVNSAARLSASLICAVGGFYGNSDQSFDRGPVSDCPVFPDPLAKRPEPNSGSCIQSNLDIKDETRTLVPGTYCKGIKIAGSAVVTLSPGIYVIKGGKLLVQDEATLRGSNVGIYLSDDSSIFEFAEGTTVNLTAPTNGTLAGILFFESRSAPEGRLHRINSNNARVLIGTFYLPRGTLRVDAKAPVADQSAYTTIIANKIEINEEPHLVLNSNYGATNVPAPASIRGDRVVLIE